MTHKVHSHGNIPFSWENKPGVSKLAVISNNHDDEFASPRKLPLPPCPPPLAAELTPRHSFHDLQIPLPPSGFGPPSRSSSKKGLHFLSIIKDDGDPFLTAYKACTKSTESDPTKDRGTDKVGFNNLHGLKKNISLLSCKKSSCSVRDGSILRISELLAGSKSQRTRKVDIGKLDR